MEDDDIGATDGAILAKVTVGMDTVTPGYDVCRAVVSRLTVIALCKNVVNASAVYPVVVTV